MHDDRVMATTVGWPGLSGFRVVCFFFSSRRRHTRLTCDWSSDVRSSDLSPIRFLVANLGEKDRMGLVTFGSSGGGVPIVGMTGKDWTGWSKILDSIRPVGQKSRSEERRVGKEGRCRWWAYD